MATVDVENGANLSSTSIAVSNGLNAVSASERSARVLLQEALKREAALRRERDQLLKQRNIVTNLFAGRENAAVCVANLSSRQRQIMALVLLGHQNKRIAAEIGISQRTVEGHRASIMKKTGATCLPELVRLSLVAGFGAEQLAVEFLNH